MNKFDQLESEGRQLFKEILDQQKITTGQPSQNLYDTYDYSYTNNGNNVGVEIKKRDIKYLNYPTHFMELSKYNSLCQLVDNKTFDKILYVNFFGDKIAYFYSLKNIRNAIANKKITISTIRCNKTTAINKGKVDKEIIELPLELGIRLEKIGDKWKIINK